MLSSTEECEANGHELTLVHPRGVKPAMPRLWIGPCDVWQTDRTWRGQVEAGESRFQNVLHSLKSEEVLFSPEGTSRGGAGRAGDGDREFE